MKQRRMMAKAMLIGAAAGGALSLLHKPTREACARSMQVCKERVKLYRSDSALLREDAAAKIAEAKKIANTLSNDLDFLNRQITELKQTTPKVIELLKETKEHFSKKTIN
ncbi:hypothetical protein J7E26_00505 [Bacillus sp. ISL-51]|uniref:hypothetical protein n=1 Tax=Bacteria TaxID=2 RepID=UPI001BE549B6|nr:MULTISPECIES: hypothetical protein [Bacteria]MBT2572451.1 hypothetical protein [Bacillus sp. ISL-51]MBT2634386.1 hypothetical protein [Bacillus sp. ISL-26]MBT2711514.1 hypothetical protein [Pseudomonas sp. ISL-88]